MLQLPLILALALALTFAVIRSGNGLHEAQTPLVFFAAVMAGAALSAMLFHLQGARRATRPVLAWAGVFACLATALIWRERIEETARLFAAAPAPTAALAASTGEVELVRAWDGHFRAIAEVNDRSVALLIDTGASLVLLRHDDAERIGLNMRGLDYSIPVTTANGRSYVAPVVLASVRIGDVELRDVRGAVAEEGKLQSSLLGMSFLEGLFETTIRGNRILLRQ
ncbi:TIGR02281 family clan AA aspartic protease [Paroceanicella profunda]|uniref:TIGR02281 family clan AA aspartic protease n=1 Tax=Paroceanicella profunda TaxID=2579971 RepID=A0A5B8FZK4_9RHOB|nr:TIGR02281 family clan AA aspartic protease [Paroceanicella profunda]QDL93114.1 TIGR02281 family clan AA aspartic protease [Paroceanicella profunda]